MSLVNTTNPTNYILHLPDNGLTEMTQMNVQMYKPPVIEISGVDVPSGPLGKSRNMLPGTTLKYKPITFTFLVDQYFTAWLEMYRWNLAIQNYPSYNNKSFEDVSSADMYLHILNNAKDSTIMIHKFSLPFPSLIYPPTFNHNASTDYPMLMNVEFKYNMFTVLDANGEEIKPRIGIKEAGKIDFEKNKEEFVTKEDVLASFDKPFLQG